MLFGHVAPSGRLPFTVFANLAQVKDIADYELTTQPGRTYLYYDDSSIAKLGPPQYWFGFGLAYTRFAYSSLTLKKLSECKIRVNLTVANVGKVASREVAQLYLKRPSPPSEVAMAPWMLKGYERTKILAPGSSTTLAFVLTHVELSTVLEDGSRVVTAGRYTVHVGGGNPRDSRPQAKPVVGSVTVQAGCGNN